MPLILVGLRGLLGVLERTWGSPPILGGLRGTLVIPGWVWGVPLDFRGLQGRGWNPQGSTMGVWGCFGGPGGGVQGSLPDLKGVPSDFGVPWGCHLQLVEAELAVLAPRPLPIGQDPTAAHHDGTWGGAVGGS